MGWDEKRVANLELSHHAMRQDEAEKLAAFFNITPAQLRGCKIKITFL